MASKSHPHKSSAPLDDENAALLSQLESQRNRNSPTDSLHRSNTSTSSVPTQAASSILHSYFSTKFMQGFAMLFPIVVTLYISYFVLEFFDTFFSPLYSYLFGFQVFGLGFLTSMLFIFATGVFASSWVGARLVGLGEVIIRRVPLVTHIYGAAKQVSAAMNPEGETANSFREFVIIRHPRLGEYAFGFITSQTCLQLPHINNKKSKNSNSGGDMNMNMKEGTTTATTANSGGYYEDHELYAVYVPTNHIYVGDVLLLDGSDIIKTNLSVREGIEMMVSVGLTLPGRLTGSYKK